MDDLLPCPFCGSSEIVTDGHYAKCGCCGARGPVSYPVPDSGIKWNSRPTEQAARKEVLVLAGKVMRYPATPDFDKRWAAFVKRFEGEWGK